MEEGEDEIAGTPSKSGTQAGPTSARPRPANFPRPFSHSALACFRNLLDDLLRLLRRAVRVPQHALDEVEVDTAVAIREGRKDARGG